MTEKTIDSDRHRGELAPSRPQGSHSPQLFATTLVAQVPRRRMFVPTSIGLLRSQRGLKEENCVHPQSEDEMAKGQLRSNREKKKPKADKNKKKNTPAASPFMSSSVVGKGLHGKKSS